ncbi:hypothetical protein LTR86_009880 [Recurvomyces mirabilis]|nr:hypothetical protein LTR86_009880 [Recurvomyces mirabilis]
MSTYASYDSIQYRILRLNSVPVFLSPLTPLDHLNILRAGAAAAIRRRMCDEAAKLAPRKSGTRVPPDVSTQIVTTKPRKPISLNVLLLGARHSGKEALLRRLEFDQYDADYYDPTLEEYNYRTRYQLGRGLPDVLVNFAMMSYAVGYTALLNHMIKEHGYFMLVYRADGLSGLEVLEMLYNDHVATRQPPATYVMVVATCIDLLSADREDGLNAGRAFAQKYGVDFVPVSAKTGEGCIVLEAVLKAATSDRQPR